MGGDKNRPGAAIQRDFQQRAAVQPQDGAAVAVQIANGLQPPGQGLRFLQAGQQNHMVYLAGFAILLIDGADFPRKHKPGRRPGHGAGQALAFLEGIQPLLRRFQLLLQFLPPFGMGEIPRAQQGDALHPGPKLQVRRIAIGAGGSGITGMNVQIGNQHGARPLLSIVFVSYYSKFRLFRQMRQGFAPPRR